MCLLVVDPHLLVRALEDQHGQEAKLLSLLIYGLARMRVQALREECDTLQQSLGGWVPPQKLAKLRAYGERQCAAAHHQKTQIERALEQHVPTELLLVTSPPLRRELRHLAQAAQSSGSSHVDPHRVNHEIARCTWQTVTETETEPHPFGVSPREYLIHTALAAEAQTLITDDADLVLSNNAAHRDSKTHQSVRPYALHEFCQEQLPSQVEFDAIDAPAVFRAAKSPSAKA